MGKKKGQKPIYDRKALERKAAQDKGREGAPAGHRGLPSQEGEVLTSAVEQEINAPSVKELVGGFLERNLVASRDAQKLPEGVHKLFELTRDGMSTPDNYKDTIISDPSISYEDVAEAIHLGIKAGTYISYQNSKER